MAVDPRKRQKKLQRHAANRKAKKVMLRRETAVGLTGRLTAAANDPVVDSLVTADLWDQGMGWILLSREIPSGGVAYAIFLVDRYCLGVKDVNAGIASRFEYDNQILHAMRSKFRSKSVTPATVRRFVESAVEYAHNLGFKPHADYQQGRLLFGAIDPAQATEELEFGKDGKPFFIAGPNDNTARCRSILAILERSCGAKGFHYLLPMDPADGDSFEIPT